MPSSPAKSSNDRRAQRILDAAAALFVHYGYDKTTVSDIAREAGVSKGAIYLHFESKDALFEELLLRETMQYSEHWLALIEADPKGGTIGRMYRNMLHALDRNAFMSAIFRRDRRVLGNYIRKPGALLRNRGMQSTRHEFVQLMQDAGAIRRDLDPRVTAHIMNILAYGLVAMEEVMDPEDIPPTDDLIEGIAEVMDRALTPADGGDSTAGKAALRQVFEASRERFEAIRAAQQQEEPHD
jgi:TetR/AcrR family acrAB operon transcriptional repressor